MGRQPRRHRWIGTLLLLGGVLSASAFTVYAAERTTPEPVTGPASDGGTIISLPPGSNQLASAIAAAGRGGTVVLQAGVHTESASVLITQQVTIVGEPGAVLESVTTIGPEVDAALHFFGATGSRVQGIEFRPPSGTFGEAAVLVHDSASMVVAGNNIRGFRRSIVVQNGDSVEITGNTVAARGIGIVVINGRSARITNNAVTGAATFGIWACDREGIATGNILTGNNIGLILCKVPVGGFRFSGVPIGSTDTGREWTVRDNVGTGNAWGILVSDGANHNTIGRNNLSDNSRYDLELSGDSFRFGFLTPASFSNTVSTAGGRAMVIKDCGFDNKITGPATLVDTTVDPCF